jgi:hypothetical protein
MPVQIPPTEDTSPPAPRVVIVMGVSGCGKSTAILLHSQFKALEEPGPDRKSCHRLNRAETTRDRRAKLVSAEHGRMRSAAQANISEIIRPWRVDEPVRSCRCPPRCHPIR